MGPIDQRDLDIVLSHGLDVCPECGGGGKVERHGGETFVLAATCEDCGHEWELDF